MTRKTFDSITLLSVMFLVILVMSAIVGVISIGMSKSHCACEKQKIGSTK